MEWTLEWLFSSVSMLKQKSECGCQDQSPSCHIHASLLPAALTPSQEMEAALAMAINARPAPPPAESYRD
jgi:hypothetical protein